MDYYKLSFDDSDSDAFVVKKRYFEGIDEYAITEASPLEGRNGSIRFEVAGLHSENLLVDTAWQMVDEDAHAALLRCQIGGLQFLPVQVVHQDGRSVGGFWALNVLNALDAQDVLDWDNTRWIYPERRHEPYPLMGIIRPAFHTDRLGGADIFRLRHVTDIGIAVYVSERFKSCLENARAARGFKFCPLKPAGSITKSPRDSGKVAKYFTQKQLGLEAVLGPLHDTVQHAIIPWSVGGPLDLYYFPCALPGTGVATMELIQPGGTGPQRSSVGTYEMISFTRHAIQRSGDQFQLANARIWHMLNALGRLAYDDVLNPDDTCEFPGEDGEPYRCAILGQWPPEKPGFRIGRQRHGLLLCIEVFRSEMEAAITRGTPFLVDRLKQAGCFPYSDMDRDPVI